MSNLSLKFSGNELFIIRK